MHLEFLIMPIIAFPLGILIGFLIKLPHDTYTYSNCYKKDEKKLWKWKWEIKTCNILLLLLIIALVLVIVFKNQIDLKEVHILLLATLYILIFIISIIILRISTLIAKILIYKKYNK